MILADSQMSGGLARRLAAAARHLLTTGSFSFALFRMSCRGKKPVRFQLLYVLLQYNTETVQQYTAICMYVCMHVWQWHYIREKSKSLAVRARIKCCFYLFLVAVLTDTQLSR